MTERWKGLRPKLEQKYGLKLNNSGRAVVKLSSSASTKREPKESNSGSIGYPGNFNAALVDPILIIQEPGQGIYATLDFSRHPLLQSTLLDNYGAMHLVNSKELINPGTFVKAKIDDYVEVGTTVIPITGRGTYTIRNIINGD
jgi:hypothetical protein